MKKDQKNSKVSGYGAIKRFTRLEASRNFYKEAVKAKNTGRYKFDWDPQYRDINTRNNTFIGGILNDIRINSLIKAHRGKVLFFNTLGMGVDKLGVDGFLDFEFDRTSDGMVDRVTVPIDVTIDPGRKFESAGQYLIGALHGYDLLGSDDVPGEYWDETEKITEDLIAIALAMRDTDGVAVHTKEFPEVASR